MNPIFLSFFIYLNEKSFVINVNLILLSLITYLNKKYTLSLFTHFLNDKIIRYQCATNVLITLIYVHVCTWIKKIIRYHSLWIQCSYHSLFTWMKNHSLSMWIQFYYHSLLTWIKKYTLSLFTHFLNDKIIRYECATNVLITRIYMPVPE